MEYITMCLDCTNKLEQRLRWSRGSVLAFATQFRGFKPGRSLRIFQGEKILGTPSFRGEVKPSVPCRRFTACKRFLNATWMSADLGYILGRVSRQQNSSTIRCLALSRRVRRGETSCGKSGNKLEYYIGGTISLKGCSVS